MNLKEIIKNHLSEVSLEGVYIKLLSKDICRIFLCGGQMTTEGVTCKERFTNLFVKNFNQKKSFRYQLMEYLSNTDKPFHSQIVIAENFEDWYEKGYRDLLKLEEDIAALSNIIVIILESAGSIAELGAFAKNKKLGKKLFIVVQPEHADQKSFIWKGIVEYLRKKNKTKNFVSIRNSSELRRLKEEIKERALENSNIKNEVFNHKKNLHVAFVMHELIRIYGALTLTEIKICLYTLELKNQSSKKIEKLLFLLKQFKWIEGKHKGTKYFYYITKNNLEISKVKFKNLKDVYTLRAEIINSYRKPENFIGQDRLALIENR